MIDRVGAAVPGLEASCDSLRSSYTRRHPRSPAVNGAATLASPQTPVSAARARLSLGTPPPTPPSAGRLANGWRHSSPSSSSASAAAAATEAALLDLVKARLKKPPSSEGTPRAVSSASVTRDAGGQVRARDSATPPSTSSDGANLSSLNEESLPKPTGLSTHFRLSLDRLGLQSSEEEEEIEEEEEEGTSEDIARAEDIVRHPAVALDGASDVDFGGLVMETSSILLGSSHSDYDDSFEADSLVSI